jgi:hypothetical protein
VCASTVGEAGEEPRVAAGMPREVVRAPGLHGMEEVKGAR